MCPDLFLEEAPCGLILVSDHLVFTFWMVAYERLDCACSDNTVESQFFEPRLEKHIGSNIRKVWKIGGKIHSVWLMKRNKVWFELLGISKNRGLENSGFFCNKQILDSAPVRCEESFRSKKVV